MTNRHGIVAAVVDADGWQIMTFGAAQPNQLFEIGSVTKTFTANLLAQSIYSGSIKLTDAIPTGYQKPGSTITYEQLTTHTSGITEEIFPTFRIKNPLSPFDGLTIPCFKRHYATTPLVTPPGTAWAYSNMGMSLLGLILAENAGFSYEQLVNEKILKVLGLSDTFFQVPYTELHRFPEGYLIDADGKIRNIPHWDLFKTAIDPAGGLRASIDDMAKYAQVNLNPDGSALAVPIKLSQQKLYSIPDHNMDIGMNWILQPNDGLIWHNGLTYGFNTILAISTKTNQAVVAMTDTTVQVTDASGDVSFDMSLQDVAFACLKSP
jgi:serine-type D-Ala-D-Ala carboxypeptidase/endopeptidase